MTRTNSLLFLDFFTTSIQVQVLKVLVTRASFQLNLRVAGFVRIPTSLEAKAADFRCLTKSATSPNPHATRIADKLASLSSSRLDR